MANRGSAGSGGSGAGYHAIIKIDSSKTYTVVCGTGGTSYGGPKGANATGGSGGASSLLLGNDTLISCGGGTGGFAAGGYAGATRGNGGVVSVSSSINEVLNYTKSNGNSGNQSASGGSASANGASGIIQGHTWGGSGSCSGWSAGGNSNASYHGYVLIKYLGQENPNGE